MSDHENEVGRNEVQRRTFLKRAATVAWATPIVYTMMSNPAFAQTSPIQCNTNSGGSPGSSCPGGTVTCPTGTSCKKGVEAVTGDACFCSV